MTTGKDGATGKLNRMRRHSDVKTTTDTSAFKSRQHNLPALPRPGLQQDTHFRVKEESPWRTYDEGYDLRVSGLVTVVKKRRPVSKMLMTDNRPASEVVAIRKLSGSSRNANLSMFLQVQGEYFIKCIEVYEFRADLYIVLEHMPISLLQVVAAPVQPKEAHIAAIVGQVRSSPFDLNASVDRYRC